MGGQPVPVGDAPIGGHKERAGWDEAANGGDNLRAATQTVVDAQEQILGHQFQSVQGTVVEGTQGQNEDGRFLCDSVALCEIKNWVLRFCCAYRLRYLVKGSWWWYLRKMICALRHRDTGVK